MAICIRTARQDGFRVITVPRKDGTVDFVRSCDFPWSAVVDGPWYSDSNPEAYGTTEEEAVNNVKEVLRDWITQMQEVLESCNG